MRTEHEQPREIGILSRLISGLATLGCRYPWWFLAAVSLSCLASLYYTAGHLTYETQRNDLHRKDREYYKRWQKYVAEFGDDDDMIVVVKGNDRGRMIAALETLASEIQERPDLFDRLFYKVDLTSLRNRALLLLPAEQIHLIQDNLSGMGFLLETPVLTGIDPLFTWKSLTLTQLLKHGELRAMAMAHSRSPSARDLNFMKQLDAVTRTAAAALDNPASYKNPWQSILPDQPKQQDYLAEPQFFFSEDGAIASLMVRPYKESDSTSFTFAQKSIDGLRAAVAKVNASFPELEIGVTGLPVLENDEMLASQKDTHLAGLLALAGVALLYLVAYRGWRCPLMTVVALLVGTTWAFGWLTLTVGHLNILTSAFAVMLIGMGDYGVLWVTRFEAERRAGADLLQAVRTTAADVGPSNLTAALTTALAYFAAMFVDLKAVAELGWIAGSGVLLCALACFTCLPALLSIFGRNLGVQPTPDPRVLSIFQLNDKRFQQRRWLPVLTRRPRLIVAGCLGATIIFGAAALKIRYDRNLLHLQAQSLESVRWQQVLIAHTAGANWHALSYTNTPEEAAILKARFEKLPEVSRVIELSSLVPRDQDRKLEQLRDIQTRLRRLPKRGIIIPHARPASSEVRRTALIMLDHAVKLRQDNLAKSLQTLIAAIDASPADVAAERFQRFEEALTGDLAEDLHRLCDVSTPARLGVADFPPCLRERYIGHTGKWLLRIFARESMWDYEPLQRFTAAVSTIDPDATGAPYTTLEGLRAMKSGFLWAGLYALIAMAIVLQIRFGKVADMLIAMSPLAMGMIVTLGVMHLVGLSLNPANMIAFPLILGMGIDNGVHVIYDFRRPKAGKRCYLGHAMGRGIMIKALTTILSFGTLMIAQHRGLFGLGVALTLGVAVCMGTALVFLPCLLGQLGSRRRKGEPATLPMPDRRTADRRVA